MSDIRGKAVCVRRQLSGALPGQILVTHVPKFPINHSFRPRMKAMRNPALAKSAIEGKGSTTCPCPTPRMMCQTPIEGDRDVVTHGRYIGLPNFSISALGRGGSFFQFHLLSEQAKQLTRRAISSGSALLFRFGQEAGLFCSSDLAENMYPTVSTHLHRSYKRTGERPALSATSFGSRGLKSSKSPGSHTFYGEGWVIRPTLGHEEATGIPKKALTIRGRLHRAQSKQG